MLSWLKRKPQQALATATSRDTILICDDDHGVQEAYKLILSEQYELTLVSNGRAAVKYLARQPVSVMILDLKMPELDGLEVLRQVRRVAPTIPVIISTGYRSVETAQEAARLGCTNYLIKPFNPKDVLEAVKTAILPSRR